MFPRKGPQTQRDNEKELQKLEAVFGDVPIDKIKPHHVRRYLDTRGLKAKVRANRKKALRSRFDKARKAAGVSFQFRDIRAKSATDAEDMQYAQKLLGHKHQTMTQHYTRNRKGDRVRPLK